MHILGYTGMPDLVNLFKEFTRHILLVHFGSWLYEDITAARRKLDELGRASGVKIYTGYDGLEIDSDKLG